MICIIRFSNQTKHNNKQLITYNKILQYRLSNNSKIMEIMEIMIITQLIIMITVLQPTIIMDGDFLS